MTHRRKAAHRGLTKAQRTYLWNLLRLQSLLKGGEPSVITSEGEVCTRRDFAWVLQSPAEFTIRVDGFRGATQPLTALRRYAVVFSDDEGHFVTFHRTRQAALYSSTVRDRYTRVYGVFDLGGEGLRYEVKAIPKLVRPTRIR